jgi:DnaJ family protein C protein 7
MFVFQDKCQGTEEEKIVAEARFKEISEAYSILSDPQKRRRFDSGADLDDDFGGSSYPNLLVQL